MNTKWMSAAWILALVAGCASSTTEKGAIAPHRADTIARDGERGDELAGALQDNPFSIAARKKRGDDGKALAEEKADDAAQQKKDAEEAAAIAAAEKNRLAAEGAMKRAEAALEAKDFGAAAKAANEAIAADGKDYPYAYVVLGDTFLEAHDYGKALENYQKAMELDPNDGWAATRAAQALEKLKRLPEARDVLKKFVEAHPDADADTLDALAWLEMDLGDAKAAQKDFERAEKAADGKDAEAWYGLAMLAAQRKDPNATQKDLDALFALDPERRLVLERDPTFFRMRLYPGVKTLFSPKKMAESKKLAEAKKKGLAVGGGPANEGVLATAKATLGGDDEGGEKKTTKLSIPGGAETTIADQILFDFDSAKIKAESGSVLDQVADFLEKQGASLDFVEIEGHADRVGDDGYNVKLSQERAEAVRSALVKRGVEAKKLLTKGYGNFCPVDAADDAKNRRVQFAIGAGGKVFGDELTCTEKMRKWLKPQPAMSKLLSVK